MHRSKDPIGGMYIEESAAKNIIKWASPKQRYLGVAVSRVEYEQIDRVLHCATLCGASKFFFCSQRSNGRTLGWF